jgi:hypothetical protein
MGKLSWFTAGVIAGLAAAAVGQELARPPEDRTWKGKVAGVPYNFRVPEWGQIANEYWNPASDKVLAPHTIGLGWGVNFAAVVNRVRGGVENVRHMVEQASNDSTTTGANHSQEIPEPIER